MILQANEGALPPAPEPYNRLSIIGERGKDWQFYVSRDMRNPRKIKIEVSLFNVPNVDIALGRVTNSRKRTWVMIADVFEPAHSIEEAEDQVFHMLELALIHELRERFLVDGHQRRRPHE